MRNRRVMLLVAGLLAAVSFVPLFAAWDQTKPANNSALVSAEIRANWAALQTALGNPDTTPLTIKQSDIAALSRFGDAPTYKPGADANYDATVSGLLPGSVDTTSRANSGTGLTDLSTYSLPANVLSVNGKSIRCTAWGTLAANANTKSMNFVFGATTTSTVFSGGINGTPWRAEMIVIRTGAATQKLMAEGRTRAAGADLSVRTHNPAETLSGAITIKTQAQSGTASSDIVQEGFFCEAVG